MESFDLFYHCIDTNHGTRKLKTYVKSSRFSESVDKIPVGILLAVKIVLNCVFRFSTATFNALTSS